MKLAELIIQLSANTAKLQKDFDQAKSKASAFADDMEGLLGGIGIGLSVAGIGEAIKGLVDYEHEMSDAAQATGMTIEQISGFSYALKSTGVPLNELQLGLAQFDKIISGLMRSKAGSDAIKELGLSVKQLKSVGPHEALLEIADAFKKLPDGAEKAGIASALFTSTLGQQLIPILDRGRSGILALEAEAEKLGVTLTDSEARSADEAYQSFIRLSSAMRGAEISAGSALMPSLIFLADAISGDSNAIDALIDRIKELGLEMVKIASYTNPVIFASGAGGALRKKLQSEINSLATDESIHRSDMIHGLQGLGATSGAHSPLMPDLGSGGGKVKQHIDRVAESIKSLKEQLTGLSEGPVAAGLDKLKSLGASPAQLAQGNALLTQIANLKSAKKAQEDFNAAFKEYASLQKSIFDSQGKINSAEQDYISALMKLNELGSRGVDVHKGLAAAHDRYAEQIKKNNPMFLGGGMPAGWQSGMSGFSLFSTKQPGKNPLIEMGNEADALGVQFQDDFMKMIDSGQGFQKVLQGLTTDLANFLIKALVFKQLASAFGSTGISGLFGSFFNGLASTPGRASGGPVTAGSLYMVGEQGPELFSPGMSGSIIPNGGSASISPRQSGGNTYIDARGADAGVEARVMRAMQKMQKQAGGQALVATYEYQRRGGTL